MDPTTIAWLALLFALDAALYSSVGHGGGALLGTWLGVDRLPRPGLLRTLGAVLTVAGAKLLFT